MTEAEFTAHVGAVRPLIRHYARRFARARGVDPEDVEQDVLFTLWRDRHKAAVHPEPSRWFGQAALWRANVYSKQLAGKRRPPLGDLEPGGWDPAPAFDAADGFDALLAHAHAELRPLLKMRFADGMTLAQIAAATGVCTYTALKRVRAAVAQVRDAVAH